MTRSFTCETRRGRLISCLLAPWTNLFNRYPPHCSNSVVAYFNPQKIILFGSTARGEAGPDSDIDLLVIVDDDTPAERVTLKAGYESRKSYRKPADVIPVWESTFNENRRIAGTLSRAAMLDGIVVYERG